MVDNTPTQQVVDFLHFIDNARAFVKANRVAKDHPEVKKIHAAVEEEYLDRGKPAKYQKYESAFFEDARDLVTLWGFFENREKEDLRRYHKLIEVELGGLRGDYHPSAILGRSIFGIGALVLSSVTLWWGIIRLVSVDDFSGLLPALLSPAWINRITGSIWVVGMFVVIWYVVRMVRNRRQVAFLSSLSRAMEMYMQE